MFPSKIVKLTLPALLGACICTSAHAEQDSLMYAGTEFAGNRASFTYLGAATPLPGHQLGNGWVASTMLYGLTYQYESGTREIDGDQAGGNVLLGYQQSGELGWFGLSAGPSYRYTDLSPNDPSSSVDRNEMGWLLQAEGDAYLGPDFKVNLISNYTAGSNGEFWGRMRLLYRIEGELYAGPEGAYQGDDDYRAWQLGVGLFGVQMTDKAFLGLKTGVRKVEDLNATPYGGLEFTYSF